MEVMFSYWMEMTFICPTIIGIAPAKKRRIYMIIFLEA